MGRILGVIAVVSIVGVLAFGGWVIGVRNDMVALEKTIEAQYSQNQNNYDGYYKSVTEMMQVSDAYSEDFKKTYDSMMKGRYANSKQVMMNWIKESNPTLDPSLYKKVSLKIESGRKDFENNQKELIDKKRVYETELDTMPQSIVASFMGFPRIDLKEYDIITSGRTEGAFRTKKDKPIQLRK